MVELTALMFLLGMVFCAAVLIRMPFRIYHDWKERKAQRARDAAISYDFWMKHYALSNLQEHVDRVESC